MTANSEEQTDESSDVDVEPPQPGDLRADVDGLYRVSVELSLKLARAHSVALEALADAGVRDRTVQVDIQSVVVSASDDDLETLRTTVLDRLEAETDDIWFVPDREELAAELTVEAVDPIQCEYGCGHQAAIRSAPMVVNNRLYTGDLCRTCYVPPEDLKDSFPPGSAEYEELEKASSRPT